MFKNAKVGDRVWDFLFGWGTIINICEDENHYPIEVMFELEDRTHEYKLDGKRYAARNQTLFWDEIKFEIPKKPFNLKEFLRENLEPKEFKCDENNYFLYWNESTENFGYLYSTFGEYMQPYFTIKNIQEVIDTLNENCVALKDLKQAFKELGWI